MWKLELSGLKFLNKTCGKKINSKICLPAVWGLIERSMELIGVHKVTLESPATGGIITAESGKKVVSITLFLFEIVESETNNKSHGSELYIKIYWAVELEYYKVVYAGKLTIQVDWSRQSWCLH